MTPNLAYFNVAENVISGQEEYEQAKALVMRHAYGTAMPLIERLMKASNAPIGAWELHAIAAFAVGDMDTARGRLLQIKRHMPRSRPVDIMIGQVLFREEKYDAAIECLEPALAEYPDTLGYATLAKAHFFKGNRDKAQAHMKKALEMTPRNAENLYMYIIYVHTVKSTDDPYFQTLLSLSQQTLSPADMAYVHYALFKAWQDLGEPDKAFESVRQGAAVKRTGIRHDPDHIKKLMHDIQAYFSGSFFKTTGIKGINTDQPVFIIGMPRSGTTLLEHILHAHPDVAGIGEDMKMTELLQEYSWLPDIHNVPYPLRHPASRAYLSPQAIAQEYLSFMKKSGNDAPRIVSKSIGNRLWAGMIGTLFPRARFIHIHRDPVDTCLSCFTTNFIGNAQGYTYDLAELGAHYIAHEKLAAHWASVMPGRVLSVAYEDIVADTEGQARRIIDFLGLPWNDSCLEFHKVDKAVSTASAQQVRQPIYTKSIGRWKTYERHLGPLLDALKQA
jgi:tetratricopeptide (TPR) repeat protein